MAVCFTLGLSACKSATPLGPCIGLNGQPNRALVYAYSARNIFWGLFGFEVVYPPVKVLLDELKCPVARIAASPSQAVEMGPS